MREIWLQIESFERSVRIEALDYEQRDDENGRMRKEEKENGGRECVCVYTCLCKYRW